MARVFVSEKEGKHYWHDINNKEHLIIDMEDSYILNCIKFLEAKKPNGSRKPRNFSFELAILSDEYRRRIAIKHTSVGRLLYV